MSAFTVKGEAEIGRVEAERIRDITRATLGAAIGDLTDRLMVGPASVMLVMVQLVYGHFSKRSPEAAAAWFQALVNVEKALRNNGDAASAQAALAAAGKALLLLEDLHDAAPEEGGRA